MSIHVADDKKIIVKVPLGIPTFVAENFIKEKKDWIMKQMAKVEKQNALADSMEPTLFDDDIIIFDNFGYDGTDGIYAINYKGAGFVKRLQRDKDYVKIISDNKIYEPMFENGESEDFRIVGKVRYVVHKV